MSATITTLKPATKPAPAKPPVPRSSAGSKFCKAVGPNDHKWRGLRFAAAKARVGSPDAFRG